MKDCRDLFSVSTHGFNAINALCRSEKAKISAYLDLNEENEYRKFLPIEPQHSDILRQYPVTASFVKWCLEKVGKDTEGVDYGKNVLKGGMKITRVLNKAFQDPGIMRTLEHFSDSIYKELGIENSKSFLQAWGERKVSGYLVISTNVHDLLSPSDNCSFTSCHRVGGEYYNSVLSHAVSDCSFIAYVVKGTTDLYKIGRAWCLLTPECDGFAHFGSYGTMHQGAFDILTKYVAEGWEKASEDLGDFQGYLDCVDSCYSKTGDDVDFNFNRPLCISCGREADGDCRTGVCADCDDSIYCDGCGNYRDECHICSTCGYCEGCCDCVVCYACGERHSNDSDYFCHDCNNCESCCSCIIADCGCKENGVCADCGDCNDCCECDGDDEC